MPISKEQFESLRNFSRSQFEATSDATNQAFDQLRLPERFAKDTSVYSATLRGLNREVAPEDVAGDYQSILQKMRQTDVLPGEVTSMQRFIQEDENQKRAQVVETMLKDPNVSDQEKQEMVEGLIELRRAETMPSMREEFASRIAFLDDAETEEGAELQTDRLISLPEMLEVNRFIGSKISSIVERGAGDSAMHKLGEFGELIIPFVEQKTLLRAAADAGFDVDLIDPVMFGSLKREIANALMNMPPHERIIAVEKLVEGVREHAGLVIDDNELMQLAAIEPILRDGGPEDWEVWLDNVVGVLDFAGVGATIKGIIGSIRGARVASKAAKSITDIPKEKPRVVMKGEGPVPGKMHLKLKHSVGVRAGSPQSVVTAANPDVGARVAVAGITDATGRTADAMGTTIQDLVFTHAFPKWPGYKLDGAPQDVTEKLELLGDVEQTVLRRTESLGGAFTSEERARARATVASQLENLTGLKAHTPRMTMIWNDEGVETASLYGPNKTHGFRSFTRAEASRKWALGENDQTSQIVFNRFKDDSFTVVDKPVVGEPGAYFVRHVKRTPYNAVEGAIFGDSGATGWINGYRAGYLKDATSRFDEFIRIPAFTSADNAGLIEQSVLRELARVWPKKQKQKERVTKVLVDGDLEQKNYSWRELRVDKGLDEEEATAYMVYRRGMDVMWTLQNRDMHTTMSRADMRSLVTKQYGTIYGKRFDETTEAMKEVRKDIPDGQNHLEVLDAGTGAPRTVTRESLETAYEANEGRLVKLWSKQQTDHGVYNYMWVSNDALKAKDVVFDALPTSPMPYRKGHVPRFYKENWFVERVVKNGKVNGHPVQGKDDPRLRNAVGAYESRSAAMRAMQTLQDEAFAAGDDKIEFAVRPDRSRNQNPTERAQRDWEIMQSRGLTSQRKRGQVLQGEGRSPEAGYETAAFSDPFESFVRTARATSRHVAYRDTLETLANRWKSTFAELTDKGLMPANRDQLRELAKKNNVDAKTLREAENSFQYLEALRRSRGTVDAKYSDFMFDLADSLESSTLVGELGAKGIRRLGQIEPIRRTRSLAFIAFLALNPLRQFFVQSGQLAQLAAIDPQMILSGKIVKDMGATWLAGATRNTHMQEEAWKMGAKMAGETPEEWSRMMDAFWNKSGLPHNIDHHLLVAGLNDPYAKGSALSKNVVGRSAQRAGQAATSIVNVAKTVGFDFGEMNNVMGTWLVARRRWLKQNPGQAANWDNKTNLDQINTLAREMSYGMTDPGRFTYQDGLASLFMQFMSVPHKAILSVSSNRLYSKQEKMKIAAANAAMFGGAGIPGGVWLFDKMWNEVPFEVDTQTRNAINGGMVDLTFNIMADAMINDADPHTLMFSENFSPFANTVSNIVNIYEHSDLSMMEYVARTVPAASAGSRVLKAYEDLNTIFNAQQELGDYASAEEFMKATKAIASIASGASNYYKMNFMLQNQKYISSNGSETVRATSADAMAKLFGVSSRAEKDYYDTLGKVYNREEDLRSDAKMLYQSVQRVMKLYGGDKPKMAAELETYAHFVSALPEGDRKIIWREVRRMNQRDRETGELDVFSMLLRQTGDMGGGLEGLAGIRGIVNNNEALTQEQRDSINSVLEKSMATRNFTVEDEE